MTEKKPDNSAQMASPAYLLAALDQEFLLSDQRRGVRFMLEYEKAEEHLRAWGVKSTIVVFGSARTHENGNGDCIGDTDGDVGGAADGGDEDGSAACHGGVTGVW